MHILLLVVVDPAVGGRHHPENQVIVGAAVPDVGVTDRDPQPAVTAPTVRAMTSNEPRPRDVVRAEIREFLSSRRAKITPEQAGLPTYGGERRRVPGLRREEAALLAGVSPQYYVRLERGDAIGVSPSVIDGIAHALMLDEAEHAHLLDLLRTAGASPRARQRRRPSSRRVRPTIQRLVDSMHAVPAVVLSGHLDVLAVNSLGRALFAPIYTNQEQLNNARIVFLDRGRPRSSASGRRLRTTPWRCCGPRLVATPTTGSCRT